VLKRLFFEANGDFGKGFFEPGCWEFESLRARKSLMVHSGQIAMCPEYSVTYVPESTDLTAVEHLGGV
jgi:hypothetical protein